MENELNDPKIFVVLDEKISKKLALKKGMTVYAKAISSRKYSFGGAGYGKAEVEKGEILSLHRFGYADGFLRTRHNGVDGFEKNANELCMDASIQKKGARRGRWSPILTDAEKIAKETGTISYEVLCAATRRAEFVYDHEKTALCTKRAANAKRKKGGASGIREETPRG